MSVRERDPRTMEACKNVRVVWTTYEQAYRVLLFLVTDERALI